MWFTYGSQSYDTEGIRVGGRLKFQPSNSSACLNEQHVVKLHSSKGRTSSLLIAKDKVLGYIKLSLLRLEAQVKIMTSPSNVLSQQNLQP